MQADTDESKRQICKLRDSSKGLDITSRENAIWSRPVKSLAIMTQQGHGSFAKYTKGAITNALIIYIHLRNHICKALRLSLIQAINIVTSDTVADLSWWSSCNEGSTR